jgi:aryl-alcohol dehydrogenase-like predicted oxidoreductase
MKLALGTVQMGMDYGLAKLQSKTSEEECRRILELASASGICMLDTAIQYGVSERILGEIGVDHWDIVTKLHEVPVDNDCISWIGSEIRGSLSRLRIESLYGVLLHRSQQLNLPGGQTILEILIAMKSEGLTRKIGISIYGPDELEGIPLEYLDIVQAPINLVDRRLIESGWISKLKDAGVEIHARSVFLQGLLLMDDIDRPSKFDRWSVMWSNYQSWLDSTGLTRLEACLSFVHSIEAIDKIVIGVNSTNHLEEIIRACNRSNAFFPDQLSMTDPLLVNPLGWLQI